MTTHARKPASPTSLSPGRFRLPDIPEREPDEVTQFDELFKTGRSHALAVHLGNPETTLVEADRWIIAEPGTYRDLGRYPDLLVAFGVDPSAYEASNGYVISEQGKPPDFVLEVASVSTADTDTGAKRDDYARLGIPEYWRFDKTGQHHGTRLAGDRLENGVYVPIDIDELSADVLQGYSEALGLYLRWERGELGWHDPATGRHIATFDTERARADAERAARMQAEERIRELEARLSQQDN
ncbi:MAG: Uma2 family endonuclease [Chloroflexi bacterium]|nr:Uma2 family endonuclease [Chloroflexota bacterium]